MTWETVAFFEAFADVTRESPRVKQREFAAAGPFPVIDQGEGVLAGYWDDPADVTVVGTPVVLFGDHTRRVKYVDRDFVVGADGVKVLAPREGVDARFAFWWLSSLEVPSAGYSRHFKFLREYRVPLPPLTEQRRIAAILDEADRSTNAVERAVVALPDLLSAEFHRRFPSKSPERPDFMLGQLGRIVTGKTPPGARDGMYGGVTPFMTPGDLESSRPAQRSLSESGARTVPKVAAGSLLVCCIGATVGKMAIAQTESAFNQQINAIEWGDRVAPAYGLHALLRLKPKIIASAASTTMPILAKSKFASLSIPVPPISEQLAFGEIADEAESFRKSAHTRARAAHALFASLQHRAFRGEL